MKFVFSLVFIVCVALGFSQEDKTSLPYYEIPEYSETYTAGTVASRMIDALGFRFYWATHELSDADLSYQPNKEGRTTLETMIHIFELSNVIVNSTLKQPNKSLMDSLSYEELRQKTLLNLKTASDILKKSDDISQYKIIFGEQEIPFWNQINGPIADAIWHCGQIVIYRRSSGNPINPKVNHFTGKIRS
ncbi:hypothetical protein [Winogradskyella poriferorum]|uniref:hypothetical protein n=1 Tax=Winogradskyella poriferorum TaxID=307627 RepID=UPI003D65A06C